MLIECGSSKQRTTWHVLETKPPMFARVYYITGGDTKFHCPYFEKDLKIGNLYIFPSHAPYEMTTNRENPLECMYMHLDLRAVNLSHLIEVDLQKEEELHTLLLLIKSAIEKKYPLSYLEILASAFEKLCFVRNLLETVDAETAAYINVIRESYKKSISVREIAASLGYTSEYFIRNFKEKTGISPHQYAISLRMSDAVRLLTSDYTLDEIAESIGYNDGHSFSNAFRRYYGISPKLYREKYAGNI